MDYLINITLAPKDGAKVDLGDTFVEWSQKHKCLTFLDAPYGFYDYLDTVLGSDESDDNSLDKRFFAWFFEDLNNQIVEKGFPSNSFKGLEFNVTMPDEFLGLVFEIFIRRD